jgi:DnaD/phage-associated family protein
MTDAPFAGFPDSGLATTVPNLFFAQVMPRIEQPHELIVSAYFFYAAGQSDRSRRPRFVTRDELAADKGLIRSLANACGDGHAALGAGLLLAVQRRTLVRALAESNGTQVYAVNTPSNRRALESLSTLRMESMEPLPPAADSPVPNIFALYEENIGTITPLVAEELEEAERRYPAHWIEAAFREAVANNKRSWRYVDRILNRWETEGPDYEEPQGDNRIEWLERRYREGKRRQQAHR